MEATLAIFHAPINCRARPFPFVHRRETPNSVGIDCAANKPRELPEFLSRSLGKQSTLCFLELFIAQEILLPHFSEAK